MTSHPAPPAATGAEALKRLGALSDAVFLAGAVGAAVEYGLPGHLRRPRTAEELAALIGQPRSLVEPLAQALVVAGLAERSGGRAFVAGAGLQEIWGEDGVMPSAFLRMELGLVREVYDAARAGLGKRQWAVEDEATLEALGTMSGGIVPYFSEAIVPRLGDVAARLQSGTGVFLDVGAGVGAVTIGMCERFPVMRAIALEPAEAPLRLARRRVAQAGLGDRIDLRQERAEDLSDVEAVDLVWLAGDFIPAAALPAAFAALHRAMRPGAWLACGSMDPAEDDGRSLAAALHTVAAGGDLPGAQAMTAMLKEAGFAEVLVDPKLPNGIVPFYAQRSSQSSEPER